MRKKQQTIEIPRKTVRTVLRKMKKGQPVADTAARTVRTVRTGGYSHNRIRTVTDSQDSLLYFTPKSRLGRNVEKPS